MPNAIEELNKLIQRLEMIFQVQTHEVVQDLKKIKELLETPVVIEPQKKIKEVKQLESIKYTQEEQKAIEVISEISNVNSREDLIKKYIDKYNKKPFGWRSNEVLQSKL